MPAGRGRQAAVRLAAGLAVATVVVGALSCAGGPRPLAAPAPVPAASGIAWSVILIGDGGEPREGDPVLEALSREAKRASGRTTVVFLGDNVYPRGMPDSSSPDRGEMERRLGRQLEALRAGGARGIMVPGNHDWGKGSADGWDAVRREERFAIRAAGNILEFLPGAGCPGPVVRDVGDGLRLVMLDSQWWLQDQARPEEGSSCGADTPAEVTAGLRDALTSQAKRRVIVISHHPSVSGSEHGGHFTLTQHLFPLRDLASWLWLPLPVIGSIPPALRALGISSQDIPSTRYQAMLHAFDSATAGQRPLLWASGHDHNLQLLEGGLARWQVVSGVGYYGHASPAGWIDQTRFAASASGFVRVDLLANGRVRLGMVTVDASGASREAWAAFLE
jgi:hypothetical protein